MDSTSVDLFGIYIPDQVSSGSNLYVRSGSIDFVDGVGGNATLLNANDSLNTDVVLDQQSTIEWLAKYSDGVDTWCDNQWHSFALFINDTTSVFTVDGITHDSTAHIIPVNNILINADSTSTIIDTIRITAGWRTTGFLGAIAQVTSYEDTNFSLAIIEPDFADANYYVPIIEPDFIDAGFYYLNLEPDFYDGTSYLTIRTLDWYDSTFYYHNLEPDFYDGTTFIPVPDYFDAGIFLDVKTYYYVDSTSLIAAEYADYYDCTTLVVIPTLNYYDSTTLLFSYYNDYYDSTTLFLTKDETSEDVHIRLSSSGIPLVTTIAVLGYTTSYNDWGFEYIQPLSMPDGYYLISVVQPDFIDSTMHNQVFGYSYHDIWLGYHALNETAEDIDTIVQSLNDVLYDATSLIYINAVPYIGSMGVSPYPVGFTSGSYFVHIIPGPETNFFLPTPDHLDATCFIPVPDHVDSTMFFPTPGYLEMEPNFYIGIADYLDATTFIPTPDHVDGNMFLPIPWWIDGATWLKISEYEDAHMYTPSRGITFYEGRTSIKLLAEAYVDCGWYGNGFFLMVDSTCEIADGNIHLGITTNNLLDSATVWVSSQNGWGEQSPVMLTQYGPWFSGANTYRHIFRDWTRMFLRYYGYENDTTAQDNVAILESAGAKEVKVIYSPPEADWYIIRWREIEHGPFKFAFFEGLTLAQAYFSAIQASYYFDCRMDSWQETMPNAPVSILQAFVTREMMSGSDLVVADSVKYYTWQTIVSDNNIETSWESETGAELPHWIRVIF